MGGSIRIPSAFNHLFGLKPSSGRFSYRGLANSLGGKPVVPSVAGPMSENLENLIHLTQAVVDAEGWRHDPALVPLPWRPEVLDQIRATAAAAPRGGLCFAAFPGGDDGITRPHPPVARGVEMAVRAVRQAGHRVIEWQPPNHAEAAVLHAGLVFATSYDVEDALKLSGEPLVGGAQAVFRRGAKLAPKNFQGYFELVNRFRKYQEDYADYWESTKLLTGTGRPVDGIIAPVAATAAVRHDAFHAFNYTIVYNILDYSSLTIPVTKADRNIDIASPYANPRSPIDEANWNSYDAEIYHGAPVGVQVVARRLEEEKVLALGEADLRALQHFPIVDVPGPAREASVGGDGDGVRRRFHDLVLVAAGRGNAERGAPRGVGPVQVGAVAFELGIEGDQLHSRQEVFDGDAGTVLAVFHGPHGIARQREAETGSLADGGAVQDVRVDIEHGRRRHITLDETQVGSLAVGLKLMAETDTAAVSRNCSRSCAASAKEYISTMKIPIIIIMFLPIAAVDERSPAMAVGIR
ncbi:hypothetical protein PG995_010511 [Apiospora arundinis]